ncbi:MAG: exo-alpha-sialidase, partial [Oscillospiraceae bacterium]|nr:exo-alpha-sialidase [Oscillospiraceae bacterium]
MRVSPYRSREDRLLFSGIRAQNLHPSLVGDPADMAGTCGFRIPSLLYLEGADVLLAAADRSHEGADWGYTGVALRRSADRGLTWSSPLSIPVLPPVSRAPQAVDDWHSAFYIDPVLLED